jgi:hypothetical protein
MEFTGGMTFLGGMIVTGQPPPPTSKAIFGYGLVGPVQSLTAITNLVTNTGVVGNDVTGVGTIRYSLAAAAYG